MTSFPPDNHHLPSSSLLPPHQRSSFLGKRSTADHPSHSLPHDDDDTNTTHSGGENAHSLRTDDARRVAQSLWTSLHRLLNVDDASGNPRETVRRTNREDKDVYRRFAGRAGNAPFRPPNDDVKGNIHVPSMTRRRRLEEWTERALDEIGAIRGGGCVSFPKREEEEEWCDVRFAVWWVQEILLAEEGGTVRGDDDVTRLLRGYESAVAARIADVDDDNEESESHPLWRALRRKARLDVDVDLDLDSAEWKRRFRQHFEHDDSNSATSAAFRLPSSLRAAVRQTGMPPAGKGGATTKRRKLDGARNWTKDAAGKDAWPRDESDAAWWPLLGYLATHAFFCLEYADDATRPSDHSVFESMHRKMNRVRSNFVTTLPAAMGIPFFHVTRKQALLSGVAACVLDALAETVVFGARHWSDDDPEGDDEEASDQLALASDSKTNFLFGAEAGQVVDILLVPG